MLSASEDSVNELPADKTSAVSLNRRKKRGKIFVDENGAPMRLNLPPKPSSYHDAVRCYGGIIVSSCDAAVICFAPPGFKVPHDSKCDYYSYDLISACIKEGKIVDKAPYLVPPGTIVHSWNDETDEKLQGSATDAAETTDKKDVSASDHTSMKRVNRGRTQFTLSEDLAIIGFVYGGNMDDETTPHISNKAWTEAGERGIFGSHSWDSARSRFNKILSLDLEKYKRLYTEKEGAKDKEVDPVVTSGSLGGGVNEIGASQSQIGPLINSQAAHEPLLASTPFNRQPLMDNPSKVSSPLKPSSPVFQADVVGVVPAWADDTSDSSSYHCELQNLRRKRSQSDDEDDVSSPVKQCKTTVSTGCHVAAKKTDASLTVANKLPAIVEITERVAAESISNHSDGQLPLLAAFVASSEQLDVEFTQTNVVRNIQVVIDVQQSPNAVPQIPMSPAIPNDRVDEAEKSRAMTQSPDNSALIVAETDTESSNESSDESPPEHVSKAVVNDATSRICDANATTSEARQIGSPQLINERQPSINDAEIRDTLPYKLIDALAKRYCIDPLQIIYTLHMFDGNFSKAIHYIENSPNSARNENSVVQPLAKYSVAAKAKQAGGRVSSRSSEKENC